MTRWSWQFDLTLQGRFWTEDPRDGEVSPEEMRRIYTELRAAAKKKVSEWVASRPIKIVAHPALVLASDPAELELSWIDSELEGDPVDVEVTPRTAGEGTSVYDDDEIVG